MINRRSNRLRGLNSPLYAMMQLLKEKLDNIQQKDLIIHEFSLNRK